MGVSPSPILWTWEVFLWTLLRVGSGEHALPSQAEVTPIKTVEVTVVPGAECSSLCNTSLAQEALPAGDQKSAVESLSSFTVFLLK